jgi:hypothetical protein
MNLQDVQFEDVIDDLMTEEPEPRYDALVRWSERYPQFREELMAFFAEWSIQAGIDSEADVDEERLRNLGVSYALNLLYRREDAMKASQSANTARQLLKAATEIGLPCEALAHAVRLDALLVRKFDLRRIRDVPRLCIDALATELRLQAEQVMAMIIGAPLLSSSTQHKSKRKPVPTTETFADAIRGSSLSEAEKDYWLRAVAEEARDQE